MIGSITPLVQAANGPQQWWKALIGFMLGSVSASALVGGILGWIGQLQGLPRLWEVVWLSIVALGLGLIELGVIHRPSPLIRRQTRQAWRLRFGPVGSALLWGIDLGLGLTTRVTFASYWLLVAACLVIADPAEAALLMAGYGLGRTVVVATGPLIFRHHAMCPMGDVLFRDEAAWHHLHGWLLMAAGSLLLLKIWA